MGIDRIFGKFTSSKLDNSKLSIGAASDVTYHVDSSGTDTASNIYFNFGRPAEKVVIRSNAVCSMVEINGKTLKSPLTLNSGANVLDMRVSRFKVVTTGAAVIEVTIK